MTPEMLRMTPEMVVLLDKLQFYYHVQAFLIGIQVVGAILLLIGNCRR